MTEPTILPRFQFAKVGMSYRCWSDVIGTTLTLSHVRRSRGELSGLLTVTTRLKTKTIGGTLHASRFNVMSGTSRNSMAKLLGSRTPGLDMDWYDALETLCQGVIEAEATGEAITDVGLDEPRPPGLKVLVHPFVLRGETSQMFGPGGVGKSLLALTCALSVAVGREIIPDVAPAVKGPVLVLDWETNRATVNDRIRAIASGHGFPPASISYRRCVRPLADDAEELAAFVADRGIVLVVIDSAAYAMGPSGEYGDANESVLRMHEGIRLMGTSALIVDHVAKTDTRRKRAGPATPYGSAYKTNAVRLSWEVRKEPSASGLRISLHHAKSNDTPEMSPIALSLDWTHGMIRFLPDVIGPEPATTDADSPVESIRELLADGAKVQATEIIRTLGRFKADTVQRTLRRMVTNGEVVKDEAGWYAAVKMPLKFRAAPGAEKGKIDG
jgi:AAA domain